MQEPVFSGSSVAGPFIGLPGVLSIALGFACVALMITAMHFRRRAVGARRKLHQARRHIHALQSERDGLHAQLTVRDEREAQAHSQFEHAASKALTAAQEQFLTRMDSHFTQQQALAGRDRTAHAQHLKTMIAPLRDELSRYEAGLLDMRRQQASQNGSLRTQMIDLMSATDAVRLESKTLASALTSGSSVRGAWGEMQLRRVVELAGLKRHIDFVEQCPLPATGKDGARRQIPDMVITLPGDQFIIIDAKAPAPLIDPEKDDKHEYARRLKAHVKALAAKDYSGALSHNKNAQLDFVILFLPLESQLSRALEQDPDLFENALEKGVLIASPTTLVTALKVIALGWRQHEMADNAAHIASLGKDLFQSLTVMSENFAKLRSALDGSVRAFNETVGSYESRVVVRAKRMADLGLAHEQATLNAPGVIDNTPRVVRTAGHYDPSLTVSAPDTKRATLSGRPS